MEPQLTFVRQLLLNGLAMLLVKLFALFLGDSEVALVAVVVVELLRGIEEFPLLAFVLFLQLLQLLFQLLLMHAQRLDLPLENVHARGRHDGSSVGNHHVGKDLRGERGDECAMPGSLNDGGLVRSTSVG